MKYYMIMQIRPFADLKAGGGAIALDWPRGFPEYWCPVFKNKADAIAFNDGKEENIFSCEQVAHPQPPTIT